MEIDWNEAPDWANAVVADEGGRRFYVEGLSGKVKRQAMDGMFDGGVATFPEGHGWSVVEERPWKGEGIPPVGTVCEFVGIDSSDWHRELRNSAEVTIIAHFDGPNQRLAAFTFECTGGLQVEQGTEACFSPIRTAEQIAAEERDKQNKMLADDLAGFYGGETKDRDLLLAQYLYGKGFRKVQP